MPIMWIDIETTGLNRQKDVILEIAAVMTDMTPELAELSEFHAIIRPVELDMMTIDETVWNMHMSSRLWTDVRDMKVSQPWGVAASSFESWVTAFAPLHEGAERLSLGGSGISHFDREFLVRDFKWLDAMLTYWNYDINPARNLLKLVGRHKADNRHKMHRATEDVHDALDEARWFLKRAETWLPPTTTA